MKTEIEYKGIKFSANLENQIGVEIKKIEEKYDWADHAIIHLIKENELNTGCVCEVIIRGKINPEIFVKEANGKFEVAIAKAFDVMSRQLKKRKEKMLH